MFKVVTDPRFTHPVSVLVPVDGGHAEQTFRATFRVLSSAKADSHDLSTNAGIDAFLREVVVGLEDIADEEGRPLPYSDELRSRVLDPIYVKLALLRTYTEALGKARAGN
ncbi:hypothetical protein DWF04_018205 [Cereibacter sphaeroides f. sp. denitrificans]|nr:hypothetical protein DWF04_03915 [Cereibacter sphaeroides f. sp. denitrificans]